MDSVVYIILHVGCSVHHIVCIVFCVGCRVYIVVCVVLCTWWMVHGAWYSV